MAQGFERLPVDLENWLRDFPTKGWMAVSTDSRLGELAIRYCLITKTRPHFLTAKGRRVYANLKQN